MSAGGWCSFFNFVFMCQLGMIRNYSFFPVISTSFLVVVFHIFIYRIVFHYIYSVYRTYTIACESIQ